MTLANLEDELSALDAIYGEESKFKYDSDKKEVIMKLIVERAHLMVAFFDFDSYPEDSPQYTILDAGNVSREAANKEITNLLQKYKGSEVLFDLDLELTAWLKVHSAPAISMFEMRKREQARGDGENNVPSEPEVSSSSSEDDSESIPEGRQDLEVGRLEEITLVDESERCTEEQFMAWKVAFRREMIVKGVWKDIDAVSDKKTGKELFQTNALKGGKLEPQLDSNLCADEDGRVFCFQEDLYADGDDPELESESLEDEDEIA